MRLLCDLHTLSTRRVYIHIPFQTVFPKTNPAASALAQNYAVVSCTNWGFGYFNVYNMLSKADNLDFWSHVGDNIYEYKARTLGANPGANPKPNMTGNECNVASSNPGRNHEGLAKHRARACSSTGDLHAEPEPPGLCVCALGLPHPWAC